MGHRRHTACRRWPRDRQHDAPGKQASLKSEAEIVVIGGGVIGCAVAWRLSAIERREVVLVERGELASEATSKAAGLLLPLPPKDWFVRETLAALRDLAPDIFHRVGSLHVAAAEESERSLRTLDLVAPEDAERLLPWLDASTARRIVFVPDSGFADPYLVAQAYAGAARSAGATLMARTEVEQIEREGVRTTRGRISCRFIVLAAGAWSLPLASGLGLALPMAPVRSHYWITGPHAPVRDGQPVLMLPDAHSYLRTELGRLLIGAREPASRSFDARALPENLTSEEERWEGLLARRDALCRFVPAVETLPMVDYVAGLSTYTPDGTFVIGEARRGLFIASGCNGSGIAASAGIAHLLADLLIGRQPAIDAAPHDPKRLGVIDPYSAEFRHRCARSRLYKAAGPRES